MTGTITGAGAAWHSGVRPCCWYLA